LIKAMVVEPGNFQATLQNPNSGDLAERGASIPIRTPNRVGGLQHCLVSYWTGWMLKIDNQLRQLMFDAFSQTE